MRRLLLAGALALAFLTALPANAQHGPSSYFPGNTRLYNPGSLGGPITSKSLACSFWYNTENGNSTVLFDTSSDLNVALMVAFTQELGTNSVNLTVVTGDFAGYHGWSAVSQTPIPHDGQWNHIAFTLTTSLHLLVASVNGNSLLFDDVYGGDTGPFEVPIRGNRWMIGAALGPRPILPSLFYQGRYMGTAVAQYQGVLDQLTCKFKDSSYIDILTPNRGLGFVQSVMLQGNRIIFRSLELGPYCSMPWGGDPAELCMRGPPEFFRLNNGGSTAFTTIEGGLIPFVDSPFSKWWE